MALYIFTCLGNATCLTNLLNVEHKNAMIDAKAESERRWNKNVPRERYEVTSELQYFSFPSTAGKSHVAIHNNSYTKL